MAYPDTTPTVSVSATSLLANNATTAGLPNSNGFDRLTYVEAALANLFTSLPSATMADIRTASSAGKIGFRAGAGSYTTQLTGKTTAFTCNTVTGKITFNNSALPGYCGFSSAVWTCSAITSSTDIVVFQHIAGGVPGSYNLTASCTSSSSAVVYLVNCSSGSLSEAPVFRYAVIKSVEA